MPFWTYILQSQSTGRYYCGSTDALVSRIRQHDDPQRHGFKTTKRFEGMAIGPGTMPRDAPPPGL